MGRKLLGIQELKTYFFMRQGIVKAVDAINLEIGKKEVVGLTGESGCGKSTLGLSIMRLVPPPGKIVEGKILYKDIDLLELDEKEMRNIRKKEISMVFQDPMTYLNPTMKVGDQVGECIQSPHGLTKAEIKDEVISVLERVRMPSPSTIAKHYPHQLSGGMRQRALLAMGVIRHSSLLITDEPTTALDVTIQMQVMDLIKELIKELDFSLLLITHDLGVIADICDRVYVMYAGRITESGDVFTIFENPKHPYTIKLLESVLSIDEFRRNLVGISGTVPNLINPPPGCRFYPRCQKARSICREKEPPLVEVDGSMVSCWLYDKR